jgi:hypothetical protein
MEFNSAFKGLIWILKVEMLGYDLQTSTVTQRVISAQCEHGNLYLVVENTRNFFPSCTINHTVTQLVEAPPHKPGSLKFIPNGVTKNFH